MAQTEIVICSPVRTAIGTYGDALMLDSMLRDGLNAAFSEQHSGWHTEDLVS